MIASTSIKTRVTALAAASLVALGGAGAAAGAEKYVPFVTDFPTTDVPASAEPYRPFVTDFGITEPRPAGGGFTSRASSSQDEAAWTGSAWSDVALGGGLGITLAALLAGAALAVRGRDRVAVGR